MCFIRELLLIYYFLSILNAVFDDFHRIAPFSQLSKKGRAAINGHTTFPLLS